MRTAEKITLITAEELVKELKSLEKECLTYDVACWVPNSDTLCVTGTRLDKDGNIRIDLEEWQEDGGYYTADMLLSEIGRYEKGAKVYLAGCGLYLSIDVNKDGSVFSESDDEMVGCYASVFGKYQMEKPRGFRTETEERKLAEEAKKQRRENRIMSLVLILIALGGIFLLIYNTYALLTHTAKPLWECILWIVASIVIIGVAGLTLFYSKEKK